VTEDPGKVVRAFWERRDELGHDRVYAAMMTAWEWHHNELCEAFGTTDALADALRAVAPPLPLTRPAWVWRGIVTTDDPAGAAIGLSWSWSYDAACWFATGAPRLSRVELFPFVFALQANEEIIAFHEHRCESEMLLEPAKLDLVTNKIMLDGTNIAVADLRPDSRAPAEAVERWRAAAARHEAAKAAWLRQGN
jgi:hypothetical protein